MVSKKIKQKTIVKRKQLLKVGRWYSLDIHYCNICN